MNEPASVIEGTAIRVYTSQPFSDVNDTPQDPDVVVFAYQVAGGVTKQATYGEPQPWGTIIKTGTGSYYIDLDTTGQPGIWSWAFAGQGTVQAVGTGQINVTKPPLSIEF